MLKEGIEDMFKEIQYSLKEKIGERISSTNFLLFIIIVVLIFKS